MSWSEIIALIDVIITSLLTGVIIWQAFNLNKNQQELEKKINNSQIALQQRQLKLDVYEYRREVYRCVINVFKICVQIKSILSPDNLKSLTPLKIEECYKIVEETICDDSDDNINSILYESKHLFNENISGAIFELRKNFDNIKYKMKYPRVCEVLLTEKEKQAELQSIINESVDSVFDSVNYIFELEPYLTNVLDLELNISNLEK